MRQALVKMDVQIVQRESRLKVGLSKVKQRFSLILLNTQSAIGVKAFLHKKPISKSANFAFFTHQFCIIGYYPFINPIFCEC